MKITSDGSYTIAKRWSIVIGGEGFDYNTVGNKFSFKFKFTNSGATTSNMYVRTNTDPETDGQFMYYGAKNGTVLTSLSGDWSGWYEVSGSIVKGGASRFEIAFNTSAAGTITNADSLYLTDLKCGTEGNMQSISNTAVTVGKRSDITPVKTYADRSAAN